MVDVVGCLELAARLVASPNSDRSSKLSQPVGTETTLHHEVRRQQPSNRDILYSLSVH